jgi:hypothetical protein
MRGLLVESNVGGTMNALRSLIVGQVKLAEEV